MTTAPREKRERLELVPGETLRFTQPHPIRRGWKLLRGEREIATLAPLNWFGRSFRAASPGGEWEIRTRWFGRTGLFRAGAGEPVATYQPGFFRGGKVTIGNDVLGWRHPIHVFGLDPFELRNASDFPLLRVEPRFSPLKLEGNITVEDTGRRHPQIEALIVLSWALAAMARRAAHSAG